MVESVMIDAIRYRVEQTQDMILVDGCACRGEVDCNLARIRLSGDGEALGEGRKAQVLMHEVVHAMLYERGREECENEELMDALASGFVNLIRQNPELVQFIQGKPPDEDIDRIIREMQRLISEAASNYNFVEKEGE